MEFEKNSGVFEKQSIAVAEDFNFSKDNIVIGENGAGKSRFLKAVRDYYEAEDGVSVVYVHFPDVNHVYLSNKDSGKTAVDEAEAYDFVSNLAKFNFKDFMTYIETRSSDFLENVLLDSLYYSNLKKRGRTAEADHLKKAKDREDLVNKFLKLLLNRTITYKSEKLSISTKTPKGGTSRQPLGDALNLMSPGELTLFWMIIYIVLLSYVNEEASDARLVLILDEPEGHLHPKAFLQFLKLLRAEIKYEQCWVATHSIFILPQLKFEEIVHVHQSRIMSRNSRTYADIYREMVGDDHSVFHFLYDGEMWQYYNFIAECFCHPQGKAEANPNDKQFLEFLAFIEGKSEPVEVLDYGAGEGRIGKTLPMIGSSQDSKKDVQYSYYDKYHKPPKDLDCFKTNNITDFFAQEKKFHCVILMNVLHEIDITEWYSNLEDIEKLLEDGGYLLLFEVTALSNGEQPHGKSGFLLLGQEQVNALFDTDTIEVFRADDPDNKDGKQQNKKAKTSLFPIPKALLRNVSARTIHNALSLLIDRTYTDLEQQFEERIKAAEAPGKIDTSIMSRRYGFQSQLYLNAMFALKRYVNYLTSGDTNYEKLFEDSEIIKKWAEECFKEGNKKYKTDRKSALSLFCKAIELAPNNAKYYNYRGITYSGLKEYDKAIVNYDHAIELDSNNSIYLYNRGRSYNNKKAYDKAITDFDKAIGIDQDDADFYYDRGNAYCYRKDYEKALLDYDKAIELDQNNAEYYNNRGNAYYYKKEYERAIQNYGKAIELNPNNAVYHNNRGNAYSSTNKLDEAIADYGRAKELKKK